MASEIRARAAKLLPPGIAKKLKVVVTASHNHHGPDTAFDVNHGWYEYMANQAAATVAAAVTNRRPARLQVAAGEHWFGMNDGTDPQIYDPRLNVLQAIDTRGQVIATAVQWNNSSGGDARLGAAARGDRGRLPDARSHRQQLQRRGPLLHLGLRRCPARGPAARATAARWCS